jgi:hypothetical protein
MPIKEKPNAFGLATKTSEHVEPLPASRQLIDLRKILLNEKGSDVVKKVIDIALNDEHPVQGAALKMCFDRLLPISEFEKNSGGSRPVVTINISGMKDEPIVIDHES